MKKKRTKEDHELIRKARAFQRKQVVKEDNVFQRNRNK